MVSRNTEFECLGVAERVTAVVGDLSYREAEALTGISYETIRRLMQGRSVTVPVLAAFCVAFDVSADWILFGTRGRRAKRSG